MCLVEAYKVPGFHGHVGSPGDGHGMGGAVRGEGGREVVVEGFEPAEWFKDDSVVVDGAFAGDGDAVDCASSDSYGVFGVVVAELGFCGVEVLDVKGGEGVAILFTDGVAEMRPGEFDVEGKSICVERLGFDFLYIGNVFIVVLALGLGRL